MNKDFLKYIISLFFLFLFNSVLGQTFENLHELKNEVEKLIYNDPNQAKKISNHLLSLSNLTKKEKAKINVLMAKIHFVKGEYAVSLKFLYESDNIVYLSKVEMIEVQVMKSNIFRIITLTKEASNELTKAESILQKITNKKDRQNAYFFIQLEKAKASFESNNFANALQLISNVKFKSLHSAPTGIYLDYCFLVAKIYLERKNITSSKIFYNKVRSLSTESKIKNLYGETIALNGLALLSFLEKDHTNASILLDQSLNNAKKLDNYFLMGMIVRQQSTNFLALNDALKYKIASKNLNEIINEIDLLEQDTTNEAYNLISNEYNSEYLLKTSFFYTLLYLLIGIIFILSIIGILFFWNYYQRKRNLEEVILFLEIIKNNSVNSSKIKNENKGQDRKFHVPEDTEKALLIKLKRFENSTKYTNKELSLSLLAGLFETNTKYLSEVIHKNYQFNFNMYINTLRINYLINKLKTDQNYLNYKISYLAEISGFASHSSFATVFKSITGISPVSFIELLHAEKQNENEK